MAVDACASGEPTPKSAVTCPTGNDQHSERSRVRPQSGATPCRNCGDSSDSAKEYVQKYSLAVVGANVCHRCAENIANAFHFAHSGKWLTWPNEAVPKKRKKLHADVRTAVLERDSYRCTNCGDWHDLTVDHIVAVANGGDDEPANLRALCRICNCKKGSK